LEIPDYTRHVTGAKTVRILEAIREPGLKGEILSGEQFGEVWTQANRFRSARQLNSRTKDLTDEELSLRTIVRRNAREDPRPLLAAL
jgi:hypothetical protein